MINFTDDQIKEISQNLDAGMRSFYNTETGEIKILPDFENHLYAEREMWAEDIEEIDSKFDKYVVFELMQSHQSYKIMEEFIETVDDNKLQNRLLDSISRSKPFRNFHNEIDNSGKYRQCWFEFKDQKYIEWVKNQIEVFNFKKNTKVSI